MASDSTIWFTTHGEGSREHRVRDSREANTTVVSWILYWASLSDKITVPWFSFHSYEYNGFQLKKEELGIVFIWWVWVGLHTLASVDPGACRLGFAWEYGSLQLLARVFSTCSALGYCWNKWRKTNTVQQGFGSDVESSSDWNQANVLGSTICWGRRWHTISSSVWSEQSGEWCARHEAHTAGGPAALMRRDPCAAQRSLQRGVAVNSPRTLHHSAAQHAETMCNLWVGRAASWGPASTSQPRHPLSAEADVCVTVSDRVCEVWRFNRVPGHCVLEAKQTRTKIKCFARKQIKTSGHTETDISEDKSQLSGCTAQSFPEILRRAACHSQFAMSGWQDTMQVEWVGDMTDYPEKVHRAAREQLVPLCQRLTTLNTVLGRNHSWSSVGQRRLESGCPEGSWQMCSVRSGSPFLFLEI